MPEKQEDEFDGEQIAKEIIVKNFPEQKNTTKQETKLERAC